MYPTNTTIELAKISQYLADNAIAINKQQDKMLGIKLYVERKTLEWAYNQLNIIDSNFLLINSTDTLLINSTDKFII